MSQPRPNYGVSPVFSISDERFKLWLAQAVTQVSIDGVSPPVLTTDHGYSDAFTLKNQWFPWIDEKIVEPKFDGVAQFLGAPSNRPTFIKDFHTIALMRAVDHILRPRYSAAIKAAVDTVKPTAPPLANSR
jgi:hypothetical protein